MLYKFYSSEESLLRVDSNSLVKVMVIDGESQYEIIPRDDHTPAHRLRGTQAIGQYILSSVKEKGFATFGYHPEFGEVYSYSKPGEIGLVCFEEVQLLREPTKKSPLPVLQFASGRTCGSYAEYLEYFELENTYTNRGKILSLVTNLAKTAHKLEISETLEYNSELVEKLFIGTSRFGKPTPVLRYTGVPDLFGFGSIIKVFPNMTKQEIIDLFEKYEISIPSTGEKYIRKLKEEAPPVRKRTRKRKVESLDLVQYIGKHHIHLVRKRVKVLSNELDQEIVVKSPFDLVQVIRSNGDTIETKVGPMIWEEVTGTKWTEGGEGT